MKKITLRFSIVFLILAIFTPIKIKANFVPGAFNGWTQNTPYSTTNMPIGYKKYTVQTSNDAEFKMLRYSDNWNDGWGSGYWINSWNTVWNLNHVSSGLSNAFVKNFGTSQFMTVITSTALGGATSKFGFLKTSSTPINISSVSGGTTNVNLNTSVTIDITLSSAKCAEEYILIRYTTDDWSTSSIVTATGSGTTYSATVPAQTSNKTVKWYALSSTLPSPSTDTDYLTLSVINNGGSNYSYYSGESAASDYYRSKVTGNWNTAGSWESSANGSTNWIAATLVPGSSAGGITILNAHNITLDINVSLSSLTINSGGTVEVNASKQLTISTALTNNGTLTLKSADGVGTATIITTGTVGGSGTTLVEQYVSSVAMGLTGRNWYISSPLSAATSSIITTVTGNNLVYWNGSAWTAAETNMVVMKGYIAVSPNGNKTIQFTGGSLNTGNQSVSDLPSGFNLVGNPYASYIDWSQATKSAVSTSIWYRSKSTGSYVFQTYNVAGDGVSVNGGTNIIPPMQSFWIKTTNATNSLGFTNTMRSHQNQAVETNRLKAPKISTQKLLRLEVASGADKDETVVYFNDGALNTFDDYDSQKMFNETAGAPEVFTFSDNKNLVINGFNSIQMDSEIPLGFRTGNTDENVNFKLKATQLQNFGTETELVLIDKGITPTETVLNEGSEYTFNSAAVNTTDRFSLVFRAKGTTTGGCCFGTFENKMRIQKNESNQIVVNCDNAVLKNATIAVYNAAGQKLMQQNIQSSTTTLAPAFKAGVYMVQLNSEGKSYRVKVIM